MKQFMSSEAGLRAMQVPEESGLEFMQEVQPFVFFVAPIHPGWNVKAVRV